MTFDVVSLGETMGALRLTGPLLSGTNASVSIAGSESNVAIGLSRLGHSAAWVGSVGNDVFGRGIIRALRGEGVDTRFVAIQDRPTGILVSSPGGLGRRSVDYHRRGSAGSHIPEESIRDALRLEPSFLHITGITPALGVDAEESIRFAVSLARSTTTKIILDLNFRSRLWSRERAREVLTPLIEAADVVIGGAEELELVSSGSPQDIRDMGPQEVVSKSAHSATIYGLDCEIEVESFSVDVVDPIGAGDAFVAGLISGTLENLAPAARLRRAHLMGAYAVSTVGDWETLPHREDLVDLEARIGNGGISDNVTR